MVTKKVTAAAAPTKTAPAAKKAAPAKKAPATKKTPATAKTKSAKDEGGKGGGGDIFKNKSH
jgi:ribosomal protein L12E/L44/L45/RPP1/RPP2